MSAILWDKPVSANGLLFFGPLEALVFLKTTLSERADLHYRLACSMMNDAVNGRASPDEAREIFEAVVAETCDEHRGEVLLAC
ncbi:DUF982 domain-containing protein [Neorhizobium sp. JUb45]|uniref:DUF982 domain-containing protein n=1 Tax=unclassified Neorhizobium TaxID=2629175 RepID=UPI0010DA87DA|nr:DUF982 domain-containing protein [Neorhizobium sp. JUb45]TCR00539.1 uncharacterized protein DUF982 [Neorhizobium sp. JUb45]